VQLRMYHLQQSQSSFSQKRRGQQGVLLPTTEDETQLRHPGA